MHSYHQTQTLPSATVGQFETQAQSQEQTILAWFQLRPGLAYSPERVAELVLPGTPLTSVRRALSNLTRDGHLIRTDTKVAGMYGRDVSTWQLVAPPPKGQLRLFE